MDELAELIVEAFPWLEGAVDTATVVVSAIPGGAGTIFSTLLILFVGGYYILRKYKLAENPLRGGDFDEHDW